MIEPVNHSSVAYFHGFQMPPGSATVNHFGLVESNNRFKRAQRVAVRRLIRQSTGSYERLDGGPLHMVAHCLRQLTLWPV